MASSAGSSPYEGPLTSVPEAGIRKVWRWAIIIALGGFLFGFDSGVISGALLFVKTEFNLNSFQQGSVVSVMLVGAMVGAMSIGRVSDRIGRRKSFGIQGIIFLIGTLVAVLAADYWMLLVARIILGIAVGAASATVPVYLAEVAPTEIRGRLLTLNQLMVTIGILVAYVVNLLFSSGGDWRAMFGVGAIPSVAIIVGALWFIPESPEWSMSNGRSDDAKAMFASITNDETAERLLEERRQQKEEADQEAKAEKESGSAGWRVLFEKRVRPALIVGLTLAAVQQFGGINTIIYYAPTIIEQTGLTASNSIFYSVAIGIINLIMTIVAVRLIDRAGRRPLLLFSLGAMTVTMALMGLSFAAGWSSIISLLFMVLYIGSFAVGMGPIFWVLIGEIFPPKARAEGSSASTAVNWGSNFLVSLVFLTIVNAIGQGQTFWIFAVVCAIAFVFVGRYVPETKERDFAEVDKALQGKFGHQEA